MRRVWLSESLSSLDKRKLATLVTLAHLQREALVSTCKGQAHDPICTQAYLDGLDLDDLLNKMRKPATQLKPGESHINWKPEAVATIVEGKSLEDAVGEIVKMYKNNDDLAIECPRCETNCYKKKRHMNNLVKHLLNFRSCVVR
jgi:hypothetical protein